MVYNTRYYQAFWTLSIVRYSKDLDRCNYADICCEVIEVSSC
jgi:hypothetical protein